MKNGLYERLGFSHRENFLFRDQAWKAAEKWQRRGYHTHVGWIKGERSMPWGLWLRKTTPDLTQEQLLE